ncbi:glycerophosphodiester phosphodiesterase [Streptomyces sp. NPDC058657]|uniref:glycerophosphodiester phosphodiesterase n=1 Tax=unclassified Streptomyces TaxID=2593676 RepID=UPI003666DF47
MKKDRGVCSARAGIGHRGAPRAAPENTLASLQAAARLGADVVETDVRYTGDGTPVLMHDEPLDRMTNGSGRTDQLTDAQISRLTVTGGSRIPTLEQALQPLKAGPARLLLEIKGPQNDWPRPARSAGADAPRFRTAVSVPEVGSAGCKGPGSTDGRPRSAVGRSRSVRFYPGPWWSCRSSVVA